MSRAIQFHFDESYSNRALAAGLRRQGVDLTTTPEVGLQGSADSEQLDYARKEGRVLFTVDDDFLALHALDPNHPGIVYCHQDKYSLGELVRRIILVWEVYGPSEMANRVEFL